MMGPHSVFKCKANILKACFVVVIAMEITDEDVQIT